MADLFALALTCQRLRPLHEIRTENGSMGTEDLVVVPWFLVRVQPGNDLIPREQAQLLVELVL